MKILYLDCSMGASGDMLLSSLSELLDDQAAFISELNSLKLPGVHAELAKTEKQGVAGTHITVTVCGADEGAEIAPQQHEHHEHSHHHHEHEHEHEYEHEHSHSTLGSITDIISGLPVSDKVKENAAAVYRLIAEAESKAHGKPVELVHFHEVGALDAVCDITGVCMLMEKLSPDRVVCSPLNLGGGLVKCAHGLLSVPAPAVAELVNSLPCYGSDENGELLTPTGAALIRFFTDDFGPQPAMIPARFGIGMGTRDFRQCNCLRSVLGEAVEGFELRGTLIPRGGEALQPLEKSMYPAPYIKPLPAFGRIAELCCNLDDMTGEEMGFALDALLAAGALDVFYTPIQMKKNRPAYLLTVLCKPEDSDGMAALMFRHTSTLGIRKQLCDRYELQREVGTVHTPYGEMRIKRSKFEYDDLARIAKETGKPLLDIKKELEQ